MAAIALVPIGSVSEGLLTRLARTIHETFRTDVFRQVLQFDPALAFDSYRNQYNSTMFLSLLLNSSNETGGRIVGVTDHDLFGPVLTFVFGEAQLNGRAAIVSSFRLRPEYYGLRADSALLESRVEKEAIHEIGHTFGLLHCSDAACVMHSSTYAEEIDFKSDRFCQRCLSQLFSIDSSAAFDSSQ
jgi:archaemetzincin